jgi:hypothetical protein
VDVDIEVDFIRSAVVEPLVAALAVVEGEVRNPRDRERCFTRDGEYGFHGNVNSAPGDREHFGAARGAVFTIVDFCLRSWRREPAAGDWALLLRPILFIRGKRSVTLRHRAQS